MIGNKSSVWYPYTQHKLQQEPFCVTTAKGAELYLDTGDTLIDAISSWWCMIHGYNHPVINAAIVNQVTTLPHVMLGGLTHKPAQDLATKLINITPKPLQHVFYADSGSVGCEIALKMAMQFWVNQNKPEKHKFLAFNKGYHGDTIGVMAVSNPQDDCPSMHHMFKHVLPQQLFACEPKMGFIATKQCIQKAVDEFFAIIKQHHTHLAAFICEPIMQGAGGFNFYNPDYLSKICDICRDYNVLVIFDEVATGFGRTGPLFATNHITTSPDIMVLGKALTAGYCGHSATLTTTALFDGFYSDSFDHAFMHGPTFMGNPTACRVALTSIELFEQNNYLAKIKDIQTLLQAELLPFKHALVKQCRVLGATGVIEVYDSTTLQGFQDFAKRHGIWARPFDRFLYTTPPYICSSQQLLAITDCLKRWFIDKQ